ncbi:hypothetical protein LV779_11740 [Streptomyces thinghirensis]|nr:hypothetical protein [Streptomyces thinghirensis]
MERNRRARHAPDPPQSGAALFAAVAAVAGLPLAGLHGRIAGRRPGDLSPRRPLPHPRRRRPYCSVHDSAGAKMGADHRAA